MHRVKSYLLLFEAHKEQWTNARSWSWAQNRLEDSYASFLSDTHPVQISVPPAIQTMWGWHLDNHCAPNLATREGQTSHDWLTFSSVKETNLITIHMLPMRKSNKSNIWFWLQMTCNSCIQHFSLAIFVSTIVLRKSNCYDNLILSFWVTCLCRCSCGSSCMYTCMQRKKKEREKRKKILNACRTEKEINSGEWNDIFSDS